MEESDICSPISSLSLVLNWKCDGNCWIDKHDVAVLRNITEYLTLGYSLDIRGKAEVFSEYKLSSHLAPKTIFCHDYKGGYVEDRFCNGSPNIDTYRFFNWAGIDMFIYFSHKLVTIPTRGWLNAGHVHGVPVLGTLITEWDEGEAIWRIILTDIEKTSLFSKKLAEICSHYKFDGFLLNVENDIPKDFVPRLIQFVSLLKAHLDLYCMRRTWVIWYDSVTTEGKLAWQNKLCPLNMPFFDACDGIFLNYVWKPNDLLESLESAKSRIHDVYVGVDVWGRNCYQDGGFNVDKAMSVIRSLNMSVAIFAPAWTFETLSSGEQFLLKEMAFWKKFWPQLYIHGPASLPFHTNFCQGISFVKDSGKPWFNLAMQQYQPTGQECCANSVTQNNCVSLYLYDGIMYNSACLKISAVNEGHSKIFHRVFACDFYGADDKATTLTVKLGLKNLESDPATKFNIYFVFEDRASIKGLQYVSMKTTPKGYRANAKCDNLLVSGSVIDFTAEKQSKEPKIKVYPHSSISSGECGGESLTQISWHQIKFLLELDAGVSLTELLVLPPPKGSVLWGHLEIDEFKLPTSDAL